MQSTLRVKSNYKWRVHDEMLIEKIPPKATEE